MGPSSATRRLVFLLCTFMVLYQGIDHACGENTTEVSGTTTSPKTVASPSPQSTLMASASSVNTVSSITSTTDEATTTPATQQSTTLTTSSPSAGVSSVSTTSLSSGVPTSSALLDSTVSGSSQTDAMSTTGVATSTPLEPTLSQIDAMSTTGVAASTPLESTTSQIDAMPTTSIATSTSSETTVSDSPQISSTVTTSFPVLTTPNVESTYTESSFEGSAPTTSVTTQTSIVDSTASSSTEFSKQTSAGPVETSSVPSTTEEFNEATTDFESSTTGLSIGSSSATYSGVLVNTITATPSLEYHTVSSTPLVTIVDSLLGLLSTGVIMSTTASGESITASTIVSLIAASPSSSEDISMFGNFTSVVLEPSESATIILGDLSSSALPSHVPDETMSPSFSGSQSTFQLDTVSENMSEEPSPTMSDSFDAISSTIEPSSTVMVSPTAEIQTANVSIEPSPSAYETELPESSSSLSNPSNSSYIVPDIYPTNSSDIESSALVTGGLNGSSPLLTSSEIWSAPFTSELFESTFLTETPATMTDWFDSQLDSSTPYATNSVSAGSTDIASPVPDTPSTVLADSTDIAPSIPDALSTVPADSTDIAPSIPDTLSNAPADSTDVTFIPGTWSSTTIETRESSSASIASSSSVPEVINPTPSSSPAMASTQTPPVTSPASSALPSSTEEPPPQKAPSTEGLSTGGKVAIGIIIPLCVIGLVLLGVFFYRRYYMARWNFKSILNQGVRYKTYTNASYKDDEVAIDGTWRTLTDSS